MEHAYEYEQPNTENASAAHQGSDKEGKAASDKPKTSSTASAVVEMPRTVSDALLNSAERPPATAIQRAITVISRTALAEANLPTMPETKPDSITSRPTENAITPAPKSTSVTTTTTSTLPSVPATAAPTHDSTPWPLQQFFSGDIDLDVELSHRFENMPVMSRVTFREMGEKTKRGVATLYNQDNSSQVIIDIDAATNMMQIAFTYGSMLTLRFRLTELGDLDRTRWLELMKREKGGLAFLWGPARWDRDYLICVSRHYLTNLYAFSPNGFEAGIRMTPDASKQLLKWIEGYWKAKPKATTEAPPLLTW